MKLNLHPISVLSLWDPESSNMHARVDWSTIIGGFFWTSGRCYSMNRFCGVGQAVGFIYIMSKREGKCQVPIVHGQLMGSDKGMWTWFNIMLWYSIKISSNVLSSSSGKFHGGSAGHEGYIRLCHRDLNMTTRLAHLEERCVPPCEIWMWNFKLLWTGTWREVISSTVF